MNLLRSAFLQSLWFGLFVAAVVFNRSYAQESQLIGQWEFSPDRAQNSGLRAVSGKEVSFSGPLRLVKDPPPARLELPGHDENVVLSATPDPSLLPVREMTAEAWVRVDLVTPWGGFLGVVQDNGEFERGWILGFMNTNFSLGLASEKGGRLTYLASTTPFETNRWYHVAGTYDGAEMRVFVNGELTAISRDQAGPILYPPAAPMVMGAYRDEDERYPLTGALHEVRLYRRALSAAEIQAHFTAKKALFPEPAPPPRFFKPAYGPFVDWVDRTSASVTWETDTAEPTGLLLEGIDGSSQTLGDGSSRTKHSVVLRGLAPDREYYYRLKGVPEASRPVISRRYQFDTSFYYRPATVPLHGSNNPPTDEAAALRAEQILQEAGVRQGYCLLLGPAVGPLAVELVRQSDLDVVVVETDAQRLPELHRILEAAGIQGVRASVHHVTGTNLPYGALLANLIVLESPEPPAFSAQEIHRVLRPAGGTVVVSRRSRGDPAWQRWRDNSELATPRDSATGDRGGFFQRGPLPGGGEWGHQYGGSDNSSNSQDELVRGDLQVAWWGDPGPRPMPDRGNRNPAPLSVNGRLFVQGDRILFGLDAYNGTILWNFSAPEVRRANVTRDCSNMAASGDTLYLAHNRWCLAIEGQTGQRRARFEVPRTGAEGPRDWSFVASGRELLVGSRVKSEGAYLGDDGEWYEEFAPDQVNRVTSDLLFALDPNSGKLLWDYSGGAILNSTITLGDGQIFFIESRNPEALRLATSRIPQELLTAQYLVCLDQRTGRKLWEKAHDFSACQFMTYLVHGHNTVVVTGTDRDKNYHNFAFNAPSVTRPEGGGDDLASAMGGRLLWSETHKDDKGHHSGHLQHPVVIGDVFYSDQRSFNLVTGETLRRDLPERRGCGLMSAGKNAIFFRNHFHSMWDLASNKRTQFEGIRSGCWLSLIPAGGLLLAPETSAGCSCTHAIQTSIGYIPKSLF